MLEYEILSLYGEGYNDDVIVSEKISLELVLKEQPRSISKVHIDLLRLKFKHLFEGAKSDFSS